MASRWSIFSLALLLIAAADTAGARQGERPAARPDFSGTWTLDREISTDPSQISFATPAEQPRSGFGGGGLGRRGGGGFGGRGGRLPTNTPRAAQDDDRLKALSDELRSAFTTIVVSHHDPSFVVSDAAEHAQFFHTDGASDENHLGAATLTSMTYWEGDRVIVEYSLNDRRRLVYTYALVSKTRQMVIRVRLEEGRTNSEEVRLVYTQTPSKS